jgi:hypothetical protein
MRSTGFSSPVPLRPALPRSNSAPRRAGSTRVARPPRRSAAGGSGFSAQWLPPWLTAARPRRPLQLEEAEMRDAQQLGTNIGLLAPLLGSSRACWKREGDWHDHARPAGTPSGDRRSPSQPVKNHTAWRARRPAPLEQPPTPGSGATTQGGTGHRSTQDVAVLRAWVNESMAVAGVAPVMAGPAYW